MKMKYIVEVLVSPYSPEFTMKDETFMDGTRSKKPLDFDIHLALYLLRTEQVPLEILEPVTKWVSEHPMVDGSKFLVFMQKGIEE